MVDVPFVSSMPLEDMIDEIAPRRAAARIADAGGNEMLRRTKRNTPVGPPRKGRLPGTARESVERSDVERVVRRGGTGTGYQVRVLTFDPIFPFIEWTTVPHDIPNAFGYGPLFGIGGRFDGKFHPGTTGQHPFARAALEMENVFVVRRVARDPLEQFEREIVRSAT